MGNKSSIISSDVDHGATSICNLENYKSDIRIQLSKFEKYFEIEVDDSNETKKLKLYKKGSLKKDQDLQHVLSVEDGSFFRIPWSSSQILITNFIELVIINSYGNTGIVREGGLYTTQFVRKHPNAFKDIPCLDAVIEDNCLVYQIYEPVEGSKYYLKVNFEKIQEEFGFE